MLRTISECTTQIDFIIAGLAGEDLASPQQDYVEAYFADTERDGSGKSKKLGVRQGDVHEIAGAHTDKLIRQVDADGAYVSVDSAKLLSNVYLTNSNYVHSRYPE